MGFPEVGDAVAEDLVGAVGAVARTVYGLDDLPGGLVAVGLPEAGDGAGQDGAGEGGSVGGGEVASRIVYGGALPHGHGVWLDASVGAVAERGEVRVRAVLPHGTDGEHVRGIGREAYLLPRVVPLVARRVEEQYAARGCHGGGAAVDGRSSVKGGVGQVHVLVIELVVAQAGSHHVASQRIRILQSRAVVVRLHDLLAAAVLGLYEVELCAGSRADERVGDVGGDTGKHHHAVRMLAIYVRGGIDEVARAEDGRSVKARDDVRVVEAAVQYAYEHSLAAEAGIVQAVRIQHLHLCLRPAVVVAERVALVLHLERAVGLVEYEDRIGAYPHEPRLTHEVHVPYALQQGRVGRLHHHRVLPLAHVVDAQTMVAEPLHVSRRHGQVVAVHLDAVSPPPLQ